MLKIESKGPNRVDLELNGKLDSDDMRTALDELVEKSQAVENGKMLYRIADFELPTLGAIGVEMSRIPELFRLIKKFDRVAVLTEKKWIQKAGEIEGALIPGLEIKAFSMDDEAEAEAWLSEKG